MNNNFLAEYGFNDKEFEIYYLLVTRGPLTISGIVENSALHRPYAYKTIASLTSKSVVTLKKNKGQKLYVAEHPSKIRHMIEEKKEKVSFSLDHLEELYVSPHLETTVTHYQGRSGITAMFRDLVVSQKKGDIFYRYTSEKDTDEANKLLPKDYRAIRDKKGLERFVIANFSAASSKAKRLERAMKVVPKGEVEFKHDCIQLIYGNKVSFMNLGKLQGVVIEDENLASFQREIFKLLYKRL
jgi:sugar-specific transcriptional regulator TrmB